MSGKRVVKKSPIVMVRNFIAVQFIAALFYTGAGFLAYYAQIWRNLSFDDYVPFQVAQGIFVFALEVGLLIYFFLAWHRQTVTIDTDQLVHDEGLLRRRHTVVPRSKIGSAEFTQTILGKVASYGVVTVKDVHGESLLRMSGIADPREFIDALTKNMRIPEDVDPHIIAMEPEGEHVERKSTLRWDHATGKVNRALERASLKTVAAFMNADGGHLVIGVRDDGTPLGLNEDYATLSRADADGFMNHFGNIFNATIGAHVRHLVRLRPFSLGGKECMLVSVAPSNQPVYVRDDGREEFFVRTGNATSSLTLSEAAAYIQERQRTNT